MRKNKNYCLVLATLLIAFQFAYSSLNAQDIPDKPVPPRLVNDMAGMLSRQEVSALEQKLVAFDDSTSTQIAVVTVQTLDGYDIVDYADRLAQKWGIGQAGRDNGVLVLVKPKTSDSRGEVTIRVAYGLEGVIPDLTAAEIIDREILPAFSNEDYYGGLDRATTTIMSLSRGEFTADQYGQTGSETGSEGSSGIIAIIIVIIIIIILSRKGGRGGGKGRRLTSGSNLPFWLLMGMLGSGGRSHRGSWGGFSGGGGGGFGGFGGGSFGGGGARGSW
jgi:uncharacterized protein